MKQLYLFLLLAVILTTWCTTKAYADYVKNEPYTVVQPDNDTLHCFITGDEYYQHLHDSANYTIIQNTATGWYAYATLQGDSLVPTPYIPGRIDPQTTGLQPGLIDLQRIGAVRDFLQAQPRFQRQNVSSGNLHYLVISVCLNKEKMQCTYKDIDQIFNDTVPAHSSVSNYFNQASYGKLNLKFHFYPDNGTSTGTIASVPDPHERNYYRPYNAKSNPSGFKNNSERNDREMTMLENAVTTIASQVDKTLDIDADKDGNVDGVILLLSGSKEPGSGILWPHKWGHWRSTLQINGKEVYLFAVILAPASSKNPEPNTISHETFHVLGAPDLYHKAPYTYFQPVGKWDLMQRNLNPPQQMGAHMKARYGKWCTIAEITREGTYYLRPLTSSTPDRTAYKIRSKNKNEFFVLEYRNKKDLFDSSVPASGLLIYRIDTAFNGNHGYDTISKQLDEVYIYRKILTPLPSYSDEVDKAAFPSLLDSFTFTSNPKPILNNDSVANLRIEKIAFCGSNNDSIQFYYGTFKDHINSDFSVIPEPTSGQIVNVKDLSDSDGEIVSRKWVFEGGIPRKANGLKEVKVYYRKTGTYKITLTTKNVSGKQDTSTQQVTIP